MKLLPLFALFASAALANYCPIVNQNCDTSKKPQSPRKGQLIKKYNTGNIECSGEVEIIDDCHFKVTNFNVLAGGKVGLKWYGSEKEGASDGTILNKDEVIQNTGGSIIEVATDESHTDPFCRASLIDDVNFISIMSSDYTVICGVDFVPTSGKTSGSSKTSNSSKNSDSGKSGALSRYTVSSAALYAIVFILGLLLRQ